MQAELAIILVEVDVLKLDAGLSLTEFGSTIQKASIV
jgi:hypothetical protein